MEILAQSSVALLGLVQAYFSLPTLRRVASHVAGLESKFKSGAARKAFTVLALFVVISAWGAIMLVAPAILLIAFWGVVLGEAERSYGAMWPLGLLVGFVLCAAVESRRRAL